MSPIVRASFACLLLAGFALSANGAQVRGVVRASGGAPLPGAVVAGYDATGSRIKSAIADATGLYLLILPSGSFRLLAYDPAGAYATVFYGNADSFETTALVPVIDGAPVDANFSLPRGGTVSGSVSTSNGPLASAVVEAYNLSGTRRGFTAANESGLYSLVLPAGQYKIFAFDTNDFFAGEFSVNAAAFADAAVVTVDPPSGPTTTSFTLDRAAHVSGTLVDAQTGAPLAGKPVYTYTPAGASVAVTNSSPSGTYRFSLRAGDYRFLAADPSLLYAPAYYDGSRSFERSKVVTLVAAEQLDGLRLAAERGGVISGRVDAPATFVVAAYNLDGTLHASTTTNAAREYALVVAPGEVRLGASDPRGTYSPQFYGGSSTFSGAAKLMVLTGQSLTGRNFSPLRAGRFTGLVRDASTQQPLAGMTVAAYDATGVLVAPATTTANGTYTLPIAPGQYRLIAFDTRLEYAAAYTGAATSYEASIPIEVVAEAVQTASFAMSRGVRVNGAVRDEKGAGIGGVEVFALDASGNRVAGATTSSTGAFTLVVIPGSYSFEAVDPSRRFAPASTPAPVTIDAGSLVSLTFTLRPVTRRRATRS